MSRWCSHCGGYKDDPGESYWSGECAVLAGLAKHGIREPELLLAVRSLAALERAALAECGHALDDRCRPETYEDAAGVRRLPAPPEGGWERWNREPGPPLRWCANCRRLADNGTCLLHAARAEGFAWRDRFLGEDLSDGQDALYCDRFATAGEGACP